MAILMRSTRCPICILPSRFEAATERELFAAVANHTVYVHNAGPVDAFETAYTAVPSMGAWYLADARLHPERYTLSTDADRQASKSDVQ
jgi:hypothetical protein